MNEPYTVDQLVAARDLIREGRRRLKSDGWVQAAWHNYGDDGRTAIAHCAAGALHIAADIPVHNGPLRMQAVINSIPMQIAYRELAEAIHDQTLPRYGVSQLEAIITGYNDIDERKKRDIIKVFKQAEKNLDGWIAQMSEEQPVVVAEDVLTPDDKIELEIEMAKVEIQDLQRRVAGLEGAKTEAQKVESPF